MKPEIRDAIENLSLSVAYPSGYIRRAQALLGNGPVLEDLIKLQTDLREMEVRWAQIWEVLHARVTSDEAIERGTSYASELSNYAYRRKQLQGERTAAQILDPAFLAGVAQDLPLGDAGEVVLALRATMLDALAEAANLGKVIKHLEWLRSHPGGSQKELLAALDEFRPVGTFISSKHEEPPTVPVEYAPVLMPDTGSERLNGLVEFTLSGACEEGFDE